MSKGPSISSILEQQLDLIGDDNETETKGNHPTASSLLLAEKRKVKMNEEEKDDYIPLVDVQRTLKPNPGEVNDPLMSQISSSEVDAPKYWGKKSEAASNHKNGQRKSHKVAHKKKVQKGTNYKDKLSASLTAKMNAKIAHTKLKNSNY